LLAASLTSLKKQKKPKKNQAHLGQGVREELLCNFISSFISANIGFMVGNSHSIRGEDHSQGGKAPGPLPRTGLHQVTGSFGAIDEARVTRIRATGSKLTIARWNVEDLRTKKTDLHAFLNQFTVRMPAIGAKPSLILQECPLFQAQ
jgi:hypothetical protein